jgi:uncharacterized protein
MCPPRQTASLRQSNSFWVIACLALVTVSAAGAFELLGKEIPPGSRHQLTLYLTSARDTDATAMPVLALRGAREGPTLCLTAAIHGDELNGVEAIRRVLSELEPARMAGSLIGVPVVNVLGFTQNARETPDRRDLNRYFPGKPHGSFADRIANRLFTQVVKPHCRYLVDLHTGSFMRHNLPQLRADLADPAVRDLAATFGTTPVLRKRGSSRMLRRVASEHGIPAVSLEFGEAETLQSEAIETGVAALKQAIANLKITQDATPINGPQPVYERPFWIRAARSGLFVSNKALGDEIASGEVVGTIVDPLRGSSSEIKAPDAGRILGLANDQKVLPGYGLYHVGRAAAQ